MPSTRRKSGNPDLLAIGLEDAACWRIDGKKLKHVGVKRANWRRLTAIPNCLYAFCCGDDVLYIGKTTKTLAKRFVGYCDPGNGRVRRTGNATRKSAPCSKGAKMSASLFFRPTRIFRGADSRSTSPPGSRTQSSKRSSRHGTVATGVSSPRVRLAKKN